MKFIHSIKRDAPRLISGFALAGAGAGLAASLITVIACGNFYAYSLFCKPLHSPPPFLFFLAFAFSAASVGYSGGFSLSSCKEKRRLGTALLSGLGLLFFILWYISVFKLFSLVFSLFLILSALLLLVFAVRESAQDGVTAVALAVLPLLLLSYFLWLNVSLILLN